MRVRFFGGPRDGEYREVSEYLPYIIVPEYVNADDDDATEALLGGVVNQWAVPIGNCGRHHPQACGCVRMADWAKKVMVT